MTDGIVTDRRLDGLPNVVNEGEESKLANWEYAPVQGGLSSMRAFIRCARLARN
jgi:hypothetical protein